MIDRDLIGREQVYLINDSFQNRKQYNIPKAQLVLTDIPYNVGNNAYASQACWYEGNDIKNGASDKANKQFFGRLVQTSNTGPIFPKMKNTCRQARQQHSLDVGIFHEG